MFLKCWKCDALKEEEQFSPDKRNKTRNGRGSWCKSCQSDRGMERYFKDPRRARDRYLKRHYGIGIEEYESLLTQQNGKCRTCSGPPNGSGNLHVDHKHVDGYRTLPPSEKRKLIRGLLCYKCNVAVGFIDDKPEVARNIADYLEQS